MAPFRQYVFNKPNTMTCWTEMLMHPDHLLSSLASYGLSAETVKQIAACCAMSFCDRFQPLGLEELDLRWQAKCVCSKLKYAASHKQNAARQSP